MSADSAELEALFERAARERQAALARPVLAAPAIATAAPCTDPVLQRVGELTRKLHDSLRELGYDRLLERSAAQIPGAQERLSYVANLAAQAAERALDATEAARPILDELAERARSLEGDWNRLFARELDLEQFRQLVQETRAFVQGVPARAAAANEQLRAIMMAQDFQDLTGQVIARVGAIFHDLERQLLQLLLDHLPPERLPEPAALVNGPVVNAAGRTDVVTSQRQVDELLESLGF